MPILTVFSAYDTVNGRALWVTDGTATGTRLLTDLTPYAGNFEYLGEWGLVGDPAAATGQPRLVFGQAFSSNLWATNGTSGQTGIIFDFSTVGGYGQPREFTALGDGRLVFTANSSLGRELWVTDGTAAGTSLLRDIRAGVTSSNPEGFKALGDGRLLFQASNNLGRELWVTDGTTAGTYLVRNIATGYNSSNPQTAAGQQLGDGRLVFAASDAGGTEIWVSDGTLAGTNRLADLQAGAGSSNPEVLGRLGDGRVVFTATTNATGRELFVTDGTTAGTTLVADLVPGSGSSNITNVTALGDGRLVFAVGAGGTGREAWVTDGSAAGTFRLADIRPGTASSNPAQFTALGDGRVVFTALAEDGTRKLWVTNGSTAGTAQLSSVANLDGSINATEGFTRLGDGRLVFAAYDGVTGRELWVTDGTAAGTQLVRDIRAGSAESAPRDFAVREDGRVVFSADDGLAGRELWITDGTNAGTVRLGDVNLRSGGSYASFRGAFADGRALFVAWDGGVTGYQLWATDGTPAGAQRLTTVTNNNYGNNVFQGASQLADGRFVLSGPGVDNAFGGGLWVTDGTAAGTSLLVDVNTRFAQFGELADGRVVFNGQADGQGFKLWVTDGTASGTSVLFDQFPGFAGGGVNPFYFTALGDGRLLFSGTGYDTTGPSYTFLGFELWVTDGTSAGTALVKDIFVGGAGSNPGLDKAVQLGDGRVLFTARDGTAGNELWVSDGTTAGTTRLADINASSASGNPEVVAATGGGRNLFSATDVDGSRVLWSTDGTPGGTERLVGWTPYNASGFTLLGDGRLVFSGVGSAAQGRELWVTDGTNAGTVLLADIATGPYYGSSNPQNFHRLADGRVLFSANDGVAGRELWVTDGTSAGTTLVRDIFTGVSSSNPDRFLSFGNGLVGFNAYNGGGAASGSNGAALWVTDGTSAGTRRASFFDYVGGGATPVATVGDTRLLFEINGSPYTSAGGLGNLAGPLVFFNGPILDSVTVGSRTVFSQNNNSFGYLGSVSATATGNFLYLGYDNSPGFQNISFQKLSATQALFTADTATSNGIELFVTGGTPATTIQLTNLALADPSIRNITPMANGLAVFSASTAANGSELWVTNGTVAGTSLLKDIYPGAASSSPQGFAALGDGRLVFRAYDSTSVELWVTDGTAAGTVLVTDFNQESFSGAPRDFTALGDGRLVFAGRSAAAGEELWVTDGSAAGTSLLADIRPGAASSYVSDFKVRADGKVLFSADDGFNGRELWITDGTTAGTVLLADANTRTGDSNAIVLGLLGDGRAVFTAYDPLHGREAWVTDGSTAGTFRLADINPGTGSSNIQNHALLGDGRMVLQAYGGPALGDQLWVTDGSVAGTTLLVDSATAPPGSAYSPRDPFALGDGRVLFSARGDSAGRELWVTDGTAAGTSLVKDISPAYASSYPYSFSRLGDGRVVFSAYNFVAGRELWVTDGTEAGTQLVLDIRPGSGSASSNPSNLTALPDGRVTFLADDGLNGRELWITDGTASGTRLVRDVNAVTESGNPTVVASFFLNAAPTLVLPIADQATLEGDLFTLTLPAGLFTDVDLPLGDALTLSATLAAGGALPAWLAFDPAARSFTGTAPFDAPRSLDVRVTASDLFGGSAFDDFVIVITNVVPGTADDDLLVGEAGFPNILRGEGGNDILVGGGEDDRFEGGEGSDTASYRNATAGVTVSLLLGSAPQATGGAGTDTLLSIESLEGSSLNDSLTGDDGPNTLSGLEGDDVLVGGGGNDRLDGGAGADTMTGGAGNDIYIVDNANDQVIELALGGVDQVISSVTHTLAVNVENLELSGANAIDGTGNAAANILRGNGANNVLQGLGGNDLLQGEEGDDTLQGGTGNDVLEGGPGNDSLDGGPGNDTMRGGAGDDVYFVDAAGDVVIELPDEGLDLVRASITHTLSANVENLLLTGALAINGGGNGLNNVLTGNTAANTLQGFDGDDTLVGGDGDDRLEGGAGSDVLEGGNGDDVLDGGTGADVMRGGTGNDRYVVDDAGDQVIELGGAPQGTDTVEAWIDYTLAANVENLELLGDAAFNGTGNGLDNVIIGNALDNLLQGLAGRDVLNGEDGDDILEGGSGDDELNGGAGNDLLDGGLGADTMRGGVGDDTYVVDNVADVVEEGPGAGTDEVRSSISFVLPVNFENLTLTGGAVIEGLGNGVANRIIGNNASNVLRGLGGNDEIHGEGGADSLFGGIGDDILDGGAGNDRLDGGTGADIMRGGLGADTYFVDNVGDVVIELFDEGRDVVRSTLSYVLPENVENLILLGTAVQGEGNDLANTITGNAEDNVLRGGAGADTLRGLDGNDTLEGGDDNDILEGGNGDDTLDGGAGDDRMIGGAGNDLYIFDSAGDRAIETPTGGTDTIHSWVNLILSAHVENGALLGNASLNLTGNGLNNTIEGNAGDNVLDGSGGDDIIRGGDGNDTIIGGVGKDMLEGGAGADMFVFSRLTHSGTTIASSDTILDFVSADGDKIDLSAFDAQPAVPGLQSFVFSDIGLTGVIGQLAVSFGDGVNVVSLDTSGDGVANMLIVVNSAFELTATDFLF